MKDIVKLSYSVNDYKPKEILTAAITHIIIVILGIVSTRAVVLDNLLPFGLSFLAGCSLTYTPSAAIGVFIGYFIPAVGNGGFKYIAAMFAILAIKLLLSGYKKLAGNPAFLCFLCLISSFLTSAVTLKGMDTNIINITAEALLSSGGTYFTCRAFKSFNKIKPGFSTDELASILIMMSFILVGLNQISFKGIVLGHIIGVILILVAAKYGGIVSGTICGVTIAFTLSMSGSSGNIAVAYAFVGLIAGIFSSLGKYAQVLILIIFSFIGAVSTKSTVLTTQTVVEASIGSVLFLILPRQAGIYIGKIFAVYPKLAIPSGLKKSITMRLDLASNALKDVSDTVEQVSHELSKINSPDFGAVITLIEQDACTGCKLRIHCWETKRDDTINAILEMTKAIKQGETSPEAFATDEFKGRCMRLTKVSNTTYKKYKDFASRIAAENRIDEVRSVVSDQFNGISNMLSELAGDFQNDEKFDNTAAETGAAALKNLNIRVDEACSRIDKFGRMGMEFKLKKTSELVLNKMQIMKLMSIVCERDFDIPNISEVGGDVYISLNEHAALSVDIGVDQMSASNSGMCGDAYKYFNDGKGHFIMVLSDGMGTGGRAAVDGAMASGLMSRLIKAGFGYDCSLRILNSSMLFKSTDESLATVDIASVDLFTGQTELYKAGAAPTIVRRSGKTGKAESTSLPAGILRDIGFDKAIIKCKSGDVIVLMSDGVTTEGTDWIRAEIEAWRDGSAQALSEHLCECAKRRRSDNHEDDITVMAAIINKAC